MEWIKRVSYQIDRSERATRIAAFCTLLFTILTAFYIPITKSLPDAKYFFYFFLFLSAALSLLIQLAKSIVSWRSKPIILYLNKVSGVLSDKITGLENVSLRRDSINKMLNFLNLSSHTIEAASNIV